MDHDGAAKNGEVTKEGHLLGGDVQDSSRSSSVDLGKNVAEITDVADIIRRGAMSHLEWVVMATSSSAAIFGAKGVDVETVKAFEISTLIVDLKTSDGGLDSGWLAFGLREGDGTSHIIGSWAHDFRFGEPGWECLCAEIISEGNADLSLVLACLPVFHATNDRCLVAIAVFVLS